MDTHTSRNQIPSPKTQDSRNGPGHLATSLPVNESNTAHARAVLLIVAAALCNALAGQVLHAMSATDSWWLAHASSLTIRAFGVDIADRLKVSQDYSLILHIGVVVLGWALDQIFQALGVFIR
jgi:hypothetical protein